MNKYTVKNKELLDDILYTTYGNLNYWDEVINLNPGIFHNGDFLEPGTEIILPQHKEDKKSPKAYSPIKLWE